MNIPDEVPGTSVVPNLLKTVTTLATLAPIHAALQIAATTRLLTDDERSAISAAYLISKNYNGK